MAMGIEPFLLDKFGTAAVDKPSQWYVQAFGKIVNPEIVFGLPCQPNPSRNFIIESNYHLTFVGYLAETVINIFVSSVFTSGYTGSAADTECPRRADNSAVARGSLAPVCLSFGEETGGLGFLFSPPVSRSTFSIF